MDVLNIADIATVVDIAMDIADIVDIVTDIADIVDIVMDIAAIASIADIANIADIADRMLWILWRCIQGVMGVSCNTDCVLSTPYPPVGSQNRKLKYYMAAIGSARFKILLCATLFPYWL